MIDSTNPIIQFICDHAKFFNVIVVVVFIGLTVLEFKTTFRILALILMASLVAITSVVACELLWNYLVHTPLGF